MAVERDVIEAARQVQRDTGVAAAALVAVAIAETNARAFAAVGARAEPLIRFEGHYFDRLLLEAPRRVARAAGLSHPRAGAVKNPAGQAARWRLLERAASIDRPGPTPPPPGASGRSWARTSGLWGWPTRRRSPHSRARPAAGQLTLVARFLRLGRLDELLATGQFEAFARRYNGPGFKRNGYDRKIAGTYAEAVRRLTQGTLSPAPLPGA